MFISLKDFRNYLLESHAKQNDLFVCVKSGDIITEDDTIEKVELGFEAKVKTETESGYVMVGNNLTFLLPETQTDNSEEYKDDMAVFF